MLMSTSAGSNKTLAPQEEGGTALEQRPVLADVPVGTIMQALKAGQTAADNGPTWAMVYVGAILILGAFVLAGAVPVYHPAHGVLLQAAPYIATLIVGSGMILLAGILRLVNEISLRRDAQVQANAYYEELAKARAARETAQTEDLEAIKQGLEAIKRGQGDGNRAPNKSGSI
jgi:hypothetical protein